METNFEILKKKVKTNKQTNQKQKTNQDNIRKKKRENNSFWNFNRKRVSDLKQAVISSSLKIKKIITEEKRIFLKISKSSTNTISNLEKSLRVQDLFEFMLCFAFADTLTSDPFYSFIFRHRIHLKLHVAL